MKIHNLTVNIFLVGEQYFVRLYSTQIGEVGPVSLEEEIILELAYSPVEYDANNIKQMVALGQKIYDHLFHQKKMRPYFEQARAKAREEAAILRIWLKFSDSAEDLHLVPWELMHDGHRAIALDPVTPIVRYIEQPNPVKSMRVKRPVRILLTTACPQVPNVRQLDLEREEALIQSGLKPYKRQRLIQLDVRREVSLKSLHHALKRAEERGLPYHIWHHCGHGQMQNRSFSLVLEKQKKIETVSADQITSIIKECRMLRLAIFNVCYGGTLEGLASGLAQINVPATIGFRHKIQDAVALDFTRALYGALLDDPVDIALKKATRALFDPIRPMDWALSVLFLRTTNASLLL